MVLPQSKGSKTMQCVCLVLLVLFVAVNAKPASNYFEEARRAQLLSVLRKRDPGLRIPCLMMCVHCTPSLLGRKKRNVPDLTEFEGFLDGVGPHDDDKLDIETRSGMIAWCDPCRAECGY